MTSGMRKIIFGTALGVLALTGTAQAQTIGYADAIAILAKQCGSDIGKYCAKAPLANSGTITCLGEHRSKVSSSCAGAVVEVVAALQARNQAQRDADEVCKNDARRLCKLTQPGRGHILRCLLKAEPSVSNACNTAITNAGWR